MQTVFTSLEIQAAPGTLGFSFLRQPLFAGEAAERVTVLYLRDTQGLTARVMMLPADAVRGAF